MTHNAKRFTAGTVALIVLASILMSGNLLMLAVSAWFGWAALD